MLISPCPPPLYKSGRGILTDLESTEKSQSQIPRQSSPPISLFSSSSWSNIMQSGYDINEVVREARSRWLKPAEILFILQNHDFNQITQKTPDLPPSGSLLLYNKRVLRNFRRDGHSWRKKKDGRTVGEAHERLKVGNIETLNCYYAHGEQNPNFQRRSYWMLDPSHEHIVLVHYRDITEGRHSPGSSTLLSPGPSSTLIQSPISSSTHDWGSETGFEPCHNLSSPGSAEVSSGAVIPTNAVDSFHLRGEAVESSSASELEVNQVLRKIEEQLSLDNDSVKLAESLQMIEESLNNDYFEEIEPFCSQELTDFGPQVYGSEIPKQEDFSRLYGHSGHLAHDLGYSGSNAEKYQGMCAHGRAVNNNESLSWEEVMGLSESSSTDKEKYLYMSNGNQDTPQSVSSSRPAEEQESALLTIDGNCSINPSAMLAHETEKLEFPAFASVSSTRQTDLGYGIMYFDQSQIGMQAETDSSLTIASEQKFTIQEISPEWGYSSEATKVIIVGSFLCEPSENTWMCMFGDTEVPIQIIQAGVILCHAPPRLPGKVTICITSGNRESCSEVREFEYLHKIDSSSGHIPHTEASRSSDELLLLVRFAQMLLCDPLVHKHNQIYSVNDLSTKLEAVENTWNLIIDSLLVGNGSSTSIMDWLIQEFLNDKLRQWLSFRTMEQGGESDCLLSKKEQGIIHMIAALGFEWALGPILGAGVSINFRDLNGWTALHWAARFGREKMVAALVASGASAGAVTDPHPHEPIGKTAASIAETFGHKGLAGYLSEVAVTSHLSSLKLEESVFSKGSAEVEAENTVNSFSRENLGTNEDQLSLQESLAAVRNVAQAAARIQSAFRAHSFRKRKERDSTASARVNKYDMGSGDVQGISAVSKLAFRHARDYNTAALSIQKKYRGWKGRKDFLAFRQKVVKIQAHVRGHQVRKNYKVICWAVSILEKVVLRWRRKGTGLRGFRLENEPFEECEDEDIVKVFRKQKVDAAIDEAVSQVLSMVESPDARQQYRRVLEKYREAKARLRSAAGQATSTS